MYIQIQFKSVHQIIHRMFEILNLTYDESDANDENNLFLAKYNGSHWLTVSGSGVNTGSDYVYANISSATRHDNG